MAPILLEKTPSLNAPVVRRLANGLTIVAEQLPVEAVNLNVWLNVGSAQETDEINGMAHFLEHMVFKGTPNIQSGEFERLIEQRGAVTNAATSQDYTHYYITTAPKDFAKLAPYQLDVVLNPSIPDEAFERERMVVLEEIRRAEDNPRRRVYQQAMELAFEKLPYRRPVLGPSEVIEGLKPQQMRDFHAYYYQPQAMTVAVVGNLPVDELIQIVIEGYESVRGPIRHQEFPHIPAKTTPELAFNQVVREEWEDETLQQARMVMMWRVPGLDQLEKTHALDVLSVIMGQGRMSRLFRDLREDRCLVSQIGVSNVSHLMQGVFYIGAQLPVENVAEVEAAISEHIRSFQTVPVTEAELSRVRTQVANRFIFGNETPSDRANLYGYYQSLMGDLTPAFQYTQQIQSLTPEDLMAAAQTYLNPEAYGVVIAKPKA